jgi:hypothetical protein
MPATAIGSARNWRCKCGHVREQCSVSEVHREVGCEGIRCAEQVQKVSRSGAAMSSSWNLSSISRALCTARWPVSPCHNVLDGATSISR